MLNAQEVITALRNLRFPGYAVSDELTEYLRQEKELYNQFHEYLNVRYGSGLNEAQHQQVHAFTLKTSDGSFDDYETHYAAAAQLVREALSVK
jgi:hypothetical protein